ncbi:ATP-binding protein [Fibrobacterales bacterium]|nr:ATP-binding protein [Fibrobacterales bacterium]
MFKGGIADKLGNGYESKWIVKYLLMLISGKADWFKFEGLDPEYSGFEFACRINNITEWHQTKNNCSTGNWSINSLMNKGVLDAFANRLGADSTAHCFFVSQDNAKEFRTLSEKSRITNNLPQLKANLAAKQTEALAELEIFWKIDDVTLFDWLRRSFVVILPELELDIFIESYGDLYFQDGKGTYSFLRGILEENFNVKLTTDELRKQVLKKGTLVFKSWLFDSTLKQRIDDVTEDYLDSYLPFGFDGEIIERQVESDVVDLILNQKSDIVFITGSAGVGKSGVNRGVLKKLIDKRTNVLAFRIDHYLMCNNKEELGQQLIGRNESPVTTLKTLSPDQLAVLFIDQVDAISDISGRSGRLKKVLFRLIQEAKSFGNIKIVMSCRTFDLNNDSRLKDIYNQDSVSDVDVPQLKWDTEIQPLLEDKEIEIHELTPKQKQLLRLPINLTIFLNVYEPGFTFNSTTVLYQELITKKQRHLSSTSKQNWSIFQVLGELSQWISEKQQLSAPVQILDQYPNALEILSSEGLLTNTRYNISFFHESFFDFIYARSFVTNKISIDEMLSSDEQHLFRRTQVRQILEALREIDNPRYLKELSRLLKSEHIRYHIKLAVSQWIRSLKEPTNKEFKILIELNNKSGVFHSLFKVSVFTPGDWFRLLISNGWLQQNLTLGSESQIQDILSFLSISAKNSQDSVALVLRNALTKTPTLVTKLLFWFHRLHFRESAPELLNLYLELIDKNPNYFIENTLSNRMQFHCWAESSADLCGQLIKKIYSIWCNQNTNKIPFTRDSGLIIDSYFLSEIETKSPLAFIEGTTEVFIYAVTAVINSDEYHSDLNRRAYSGMSHGFDEFLSKYRRSMLKLLCEQPEIAQKYLLLLPGKKHECFMHILLESITAAPKELSHLLPNLADHKSVFKAGFDGADWLSLANAFKSAIPYLTKKQSIKIEGFITTYFPETKDAFRAYQIVKSGGTDFWKPTIKDAIYRLNRSGYKQWCILETIGENLLNDSSIKKLSMLRRKLPDSKIQKPNNIEAVIVGSPLSTSSTERMNDESWILAIKKYNQETNNYRSFDEGGPRELANCLYGYASKNPERFSALCLKIPYDSNPAYVKEILRGLSESDESLINDSQLVTVILHVHNHPNKPFGEAIARLLRAKPHLTEEPKVLSLLIWYAINGESSNDQDIDKSNTIRESMDIESLLQTGDRTYVRGINGVRGNAWDTLQFVFTKVETAEKKIIEAIKFAVINEPLVSVRCCIIQSFSNVFNKDKDLFSELICQLIDPSNCRVDNPNTALSPLTTGSGLHLFPYIFLQLPALAKQLVNKLINSKNSDMHLIGVWLVFGQSFRDESYIKIANIYPMENRDYRKVMASVARDVVAWTGNKNRAEKLLNIFFHDDDDNIRNTASSAFMNIDKTNFIYHDALYHNFINSPAFYEHNSSMLYSLDNIEVDISHLIITSAEKIINMNIVQRQNGEAFHTSLHQFEDHLKSAYLTSGGNPTERKKILDLIDLMLVNDIYGGQAITTLDDRI